MRSWKVAPRRVTKEQWASDPPTGPTRFSVESRIFFQRPAWNRQRYSVGAGIEVKRSQTRLEVSHLLTKKHIVIE